ncbi:Uncharacterized protein APZ42_031499 [Daphnia magna]|uniref:Uncharacterized protein n=1 Tax=Daphnia magna TaxID=35525 RepID=A0A164MT83_9CRUS|nr:Uncharacterized protein APZ42_031499 [Daphnia magna]
MRNYEMRKKFPSSDDILKIAKSIVFYFPSAGSFNTETPWDMLYDLYTRKGSLESYMRGKRFRKQLSDKRTKRQCTTVMFPECDSYTAEEQMEAEEYMRLTPLDSYDTRNHNRNEMLRLMKITYQSRRDFLKNGSHVGAMVFLNKYPRLKDMTEAIKEEFFLLKKGLMETFLSNWRKAESQLMEFAKQRLIRNLAISAILQRREEAIGQFDVVEQTKCAFQVLLHAAANTQPAKKKNGSTADAWPVPFQSFHNAEEDEDNVSESLAEKDLNKPMQLRFGAFHERQIPIVKGQMLDSTRKRKIKAMKDLVNICWLCYISAQELSTKAKVQTILCIVFPNKKIPTRFLESYGDHADNFLHATESGSKIQSILKLATETWIGWYPEYLTLSNFDDHYCLCKGIYGGKQPEKKNQKEQSTTIAEDTVTTKAARHAIQITMSFNSYIFFPGVKKKEIE